MRVIQYFPLAVLCFVCAVNAETVVLHSGATIEGIILNQTEESIVIRALRGTIELKRSDIKEIRRDMPNSEGVQMDRGNRDIRQDGSKVERAQVDREKIAKVAGISKLSDLSEKPSKCPKCVGTGIAIWLECLNCNKSGKAGYKNMGDYWEVCKRCTGAGRIAAARCNTCTGTGSVLLSKLTPVDGGIKEPPKGMKWCEDCTGTGVMVWNDCAQCKRSKFPGYLFHGDSVSLCNRCNGATKLPGLACSKCKQKGVLPLKN